MKTQFKTFIVILTNLLKPLKYDEASMLIGDLNANGQKEYGIVSDFRDSHSFTQIRTFTTEKFFSVTTEVESDSND